jgi:hypothetical protein
MRGEQHSPDVVAFAYNWPAEVIIERHAAALHSAGIPARLVESGFGMRPIGKQPGCLTFNR